MNTLPTIALSLRQPWAWLVLHGKDLENRVWNTKRRGRLLIHAAKGMTLAEYSEAVLFARDADPSLIVPPPNELERGGIVGVANLVDVVQPCLPYGYVGPFACRCGERWHIGDQFGFRLADVKPLPFRPVVGKLGFFEVPEPVDSVTMIGRAP